MPLFEHPLLWVGFCTTVLGLLALDLGIFHRKAHVVGFREALTWSGVWVGLAATFAVAVWRFAGPTEALEFTAAYALEKALSVDNLFVILLTLQAFRVRPEAQHRVLFWGVLGALVMRALFIAAGAALLSRFSWLLGVFGVFLLYAAIRMLKGESQPPITESRSMRWLQRWLSVKNEPTGLRFFSVQNGKRFATPLFLALVAVELSDLVFALDSIPAVFAVSQKPFIVLSSNVFAILGLRSLFFLLSGLLQRFHLLRFGLAGILGFIGLKLLAMPFFHVPIGVSLAVVVAALGLSMGLSLVISPSPQRQPAS
jgi:tellurite resistance protein TerC